LVKGLKAESLCPTKLTTAPAAAQCGDQGSLKPVSEDGGCLADHGMSFSSPVATAETSLTACATAWSTLCFWYNHSYALLHTAEDPVPARCSLAAVCSPHRKHTDLDHICFLCCAGAPMQSALQFCLSTSIHANTSVSSLVRASSILLGNQSSSSIVVQQTAPCQSGSRAHSSQAASQHAADPFGDPPPLPQRRVVVTGIGMVTPLGVGVADSWQGLLAGRTGVRRLQAEDLPEVRGLLLLLLRPAEVRYSMYACTRVALSLQRHGSCCCHCCRRHTVHTCRSCPVRWWQQCQGSRPMRQQRQLGWTLGDTRPS
jgi:hypothetical protein